MNERAERINGWAAMIGVIAAMGSYALTGDLIPGICVILCLVKEIQKEIFLGMLEKREHTKMLNIILNLMVKYGQSEKKDVLYLKDG